MNCVSNYFNSNHCMDDREAIIFFDDIGALEKSKKTISFRDLSMNINKAQRHLMSLGLKSGDALLLMETPSPHFFAYILACLSLGIKILIIEPWLSLDKIMNIITITKPKAFMSGGFGKLWGLRSKSVRNILHWFHSSILEKFSSSDDFKLNSLTSDSDAILTFTTGTSGKPKAVHRKHGYLSTQMQVLKKYLHYDEYPGSDLTIFTNVILLNLACGKTSIFMPPKWPKKALKQIDLLPNHLKPETSALGPTFLNNLIHHSRLDNIKSMHIGGALCDNNVYEKALQKWKGRKLTHVYGSSEAEPVALSPLEKAVQLSKDKNYFQTLYIGSPVEEITMDNSSNSSWISGKHVSPLYAGDSEDVKKNKKIDANGLLWHNMGDRIKEDTKGYWYKGREFQTIEEFELEQKIYQFNQCSKSFITKNKDMLILAGENLDEKMIKEKFPVINKVIKTKIKRDQRHRARIDRVNSLKGKL